MTPAKFRFDWTEKSVIEFWDRLADQPENSYQYFSLQRGRSILSYLEKNVDLSAGPIVDVGCGPGHLLSYMVDRNIKCIGLDTSNQSLLQAQANLSSNPNFMGVRPMSGFDRLPLDSASAGGVLLMETVEHLFLDKLSRLMKEVRRVLRPNGFIFVTTPHNEDLSASEACCAGCGCVFHPVQHLQSYTADSLGKLMASEGFEEQSCKPVFFMPDWRVYLNYLKHKTHVHCPACGSREVSRQTSKFRNPFGLQLRNLAYIGSNPEPD